LSRFGFTWRLLASGLLRVRLYSKASFDNEYDSAERAILLKQKAGTEKR